MAKSLNEMEVFYHVATLKSFSKAALELDISKGYVSQQISDLENELGVKLLLRSTRQLKLTNAGEILLASCTRIIREKKLAFARIEETKTEPVGTLKISAPPSLCSSILAKAIPEFLNKFPRITIELDASSQMKDLFSDNVDLAIRITREPDSAYIAKQLSSFNFVICATADYVKKHSPIKVPSDLLKYHCLVYNAQPNADVWQFAKETVRIESTLSSTNVVVIISAVKAGNGIARLPEYMVIEELKNSKLVPLLDEYKTTEMPVYALYPSTRLTSPKIKLFIEHLKRFWDESFVSIYPFL